MPRTRAAAKPAVEPTDDDVFEDLEDTVEDDLEDLADEPEPEKPARRGRRSSTTTKAAPAKATTKAAPAEKKAAGSGFDSNWLAEHVSDATGKQYDARSIRMLLRKAAKDGVLEREVGVDRIRYDFPKGANDPTVKAIVKMAKEGAIEKTRKEGLEKAVATRTARKAAPEPVEEVEEPKPARRTRATKATPAKAAPAKAAPTTTRRRRAS